MAANGVKFVLLSQHKDCSVSASRPLETKFSETMLQIYEFSNLLCVIVLVILFFLIKMEGPLPPGKRRRIMNLVDL